MTEPNKPEAPAEQGKKENGWVKLFHPRGVQVTLPVTEQAVDYKAMLANVTVALDSGWLVVAPGLDQGEHKDMVAFVVRRGREDKGHEIPVIDLYAAGDSYRYSFMSAYLNNEADARAFEFASGLSLAKLPLYVGSGKLERGVSKQTDAMIVAAPKPFGVIWKDNPAYNPEETDAKKKKPKRKFVRWELVEQSHEGNGQQDKPESELANDWKEYLCSRLKVAKTIEEAQTTFAQMNSHTRELLAKYKMLDAVIAEKDAAKARFTVKV